MSREIIDSLDCRRASANPPLGARGAVGNRPLSTLPPVTFLTYDEYDNSPTQGPAVRDRGVVYLAGPITGETFEEANWWRAEAESVLSAQGWRCLSPLRGKKKFDPGTPLPNDFDGDRDAFSRDTFDIDRCDVMLVNFEGTERVSVGTVAEIGYAYARGKHIVIVDGDDSFHIGHLFMRNMASVIVPTLANALGWLADL